ncbi:hypothetical protein FDENT_4626 [Fusarium denticulatum]|uniref:Uncharacterized protein n=1 Tax=Fusarium denticulatum TaxID=48507 RepID=A0A8H5XAA0_9HYPO|nr:hypothetical protein FDENT_4626 [Fusarium denticulatum]
MLSREPMPEPEPVHVIVEPLEKPFDTIPEEAKPWWATPWWARNRQRIEIAIALVLWPILVMCFVVQGCLMVESDPDFHLLTQRSWALHLRGKGGYWSQSTYKTEIGLRWMGAYNASLGVLS